MQETKGHTCEGLRLELRLQEGGVVLGLAQLRFLVSEEAHPALARHAICAALQASTKIVDMELLTSLANFRRPNRTCHVSELFPGVRSTLLWA